MSRGERPSVARGDMVKAVARTTRYSQEVVSTVLDAVFHGRTGFIVVTLSRGVDVVITGLGTFRAVDLPWRTIHNPQSGEMERCEPTRSVRFKPAVKVKERIARTAPVYPDPEAAPPSRPTPRRAARPAPIVEEEDDDTDDNDDSDESPVPVDAAPEALPEDRDLLPIVDAPNAPPVEEAPVPRPRPSRGRVRPADAV